MDKRFIIIERSISNHCCFTYTVVDTQKGKPETDYWEGNVCECFERDYAQKIVTSLNIVYGD